MTDSLCHTAEGLLDTLQAAIEQSGRHPSELYIDNVAEDADNIRVTLRQQTLSDGSIVFNLRVGL